MRNGLFIIGALFLGLALLCAGPVLARAEEHGGGEASKSETKSEAEGEGKNKGKDKAKKDKKAITGGKLAGDPIYVHLQPMILPVITKNGAEQLVTIIIDLQVKNLDVADKLHANMPRVNDAVLQGLYGGLGEGSLRDGHLVSVMRIKDKIAKSIDKVIGPDLVTDVLIQAISQRML